MIYNKIKKIIFCILLVFSNHTFAKKYHVFSNKMNFYAAFQDCASRNMNLATIYSQAEQADLEKVVIAAGKESSHLLIGGTDLAVGGTFTWLATGHTFSYNKWTPGEPNNNENERCVIVWPKPAGTISWNNVPCSIEYEYICEERDAPVININFECPRNN